MILTHALGFVTLDWSGMVLHSESEHYFYFPNIVPATNLSNVVVTTTLKIAKNGSCFYKQPLYSYSKANSIQLIAGLFAELLQHNQLNSNVSWLSSGKIYDFGEGKQYDLKNAIYLDTWGALLQQTIVTAKKMAYALLLMLPLNVVAYLVYEAIFIGLSTKPKDFHERLSKYAAVALRILYFFLVKLFFRSVPSTKTGLVT